MAWASLLRTSQSIITQITATAPYASSSPPSSSSSSSSPSFSRLKRGNRAGGKGELETTALIRGDDGKCLCCGIKTSCGWAGWACSATARFTSEIKIDLVNRALNLPASRDKLRVVCFFFRNGGFWTSRSGCYLQQIEIITRSVRKLCKLAL